MHRTQETEYIMVDVCRGGIQYFKRFLFILHYKGR